jgi:adenine-specific DNA-methyltransferase
MNVGTDGNGKRPEDMTREELLELLRAQREEGIRITFAGKDVARRIARKVQPRTSRRIAKYSVGSEEDQARNQVIEGENLQAMVTLYRDRGQVDLILTDPPYNTGRDFRYNDKWDDDPNDPGLGELVAEDDGSRHTKWMKFMWPRLKVMRDMLKPGGVLAICIDHRELFRLGQMLDELFREENRVAVISWQKMAGSKNQDQGVSTTTEYILVYGRDLDEIKTGKVERSGVTAGGYRNPDRDPKGPWAPSDSTLMGASSHAGQVYAIQNPFTGKLHYPQEGRCWRNERAKMKAAVEAWGVVYEDVDLGDGLRPGLVIRGVRDPKNAGPKTDPVIAKARSSALARHAAGNWPRAFWRADRQRRPGEGELRYKTYEEEVKEGVVPTTYWPDEWDVLELGSTAWPHEEAGTTHTGLRELNAIVGRGHGFDTVKPLALIERIINLWCPEDGLILDPFAGSGTTGHAVLKLNQEDSASRRFVLIEQGRPEKGDPYARSLLANRLQRAISGKWADGKGTAVGGGFRFSQLQKTVDAKALLGMEREEMTDAVIASHFDSSRRGGPGLVIMANEGYEYLVGRNSEGEGFFLIWNLSKGSPVLDEKVYDAVVKEARAAALKPRYHVYARFNYFQSDDVQFYQIPDQILLDFGLSPNEPFNSESAAQ